MADAIEYLGDEDAKETVRFVKIFDRFFDMLNTDEAHFKRKPDLEPYMSSDDSRLKVISFTALE